MHHYDWLFFSSCFLKTSNPIPCCHSLYLCTGHTGYVAASCVTEYFLKDMRHIHKGRSSQSVHYKKPWDRKEGTLLKEKEKKQIQLLFAKQKQNQCQAFRIFM